MTAESKRASADNGGYDEARPGSEALPENRLGTADASSGGFGSPVASGDADPLAALYGEQSHRAPQDSANDLRVRADSLLDEMMLGAVDVSAGASGNGDGAAYRRQATSTSGAPEHAVSGNGNPPVSDSLGARPNWTIRGDAADDGKTMSNGRYAENGADSHIDQLDQPSSSVARGNGAKSYSYVDGAQFSNSAAERTASPAPTPEWRVKSGGGDAGGSESAWTEYVSSFQSYGDPAASVEKWQPEPLDEAYGIGSSAYRTPEQGDSFSRSSASIPNGASPAASNPNAGRGTVSSMVAPIGPRRTGLLPREARFDVDKVNREIAELHEEIRLLLPIGHDQAERAQHLLDKAHTIASSDPNRSAEVEYYMQQVRSIVERTRQSRSWSDLYRSRLRLYLAAWTLLSTLTLVALLSSQFQIEAAFSSLFGVVSDGVFMRNFAGALGSLMAGALGGSLGALFNMRKHEKTPHGFFDRKYGLRGLILPVIGALIGVLIYLLFGVIYFFAGINPSLSAVAMALPALISFVFGFSQESIYGTNS